MILLSKSTCPRCISLTISFVMQSAREQCVTKGNQPFIFIKDPMRPTRGFNSERANPFRDHFRAWQSSRQKKSGNKRDNHLS